MILGGWAAAVTAGAAVASTFWHMVPAPHETSAMASETEGIKTDMLSVPVIRGGAVIGYLLIQLSFQVDHDQTTAAGFDPAPFIVDAALRVFLTAHRIDVANIGRKTLDEWTDEIVRQANARLGRDLVKSVLVQQLNYVRREDIRTNWINHGK